MLTNVEGSRPIANAIETIKKENDNLTVRNSTVDSDGTTKYTDAITGNRAAKAGDIASKGDAPALGTTENE